MKPANMNPKSVVKPGYRLNMSLQKKISDVLIDALTRGGQHRALDTFKKTKASWWTNTKSDSYLYTRWLLNEAHILVGTHHRHFTEDEIKLINETTREFIRLMK